MKKLVIVITNGLGFRNFIMSYFIKAVLQKFYTITIYSGLPISAYASIPKSNIVIKELEVYEKAKQIGFSRILPLGFVKKVLLK